MVKSSSKAKSDRVAFKMPPVQSLTKRKRTEKVRKQDTEDLLLIQKQHEEEEKKLTEEAAAFITGSLNKRKSERIEKLRKQAFERKEKLLKEASAFFNGLKKKRVTSAEVEKLKEVGITSCDALLAYCKKTPKINGLTELRLHEICRSALEAGKVSGVNRLLKDTAFAKKQHFVVVRNLPKGVTEQELRKRFRLVGGFMRVEIRKSSKCAFVYYNSREDAQRAARVMNGEFINNQAISVKLDGEPRGLFPYCS